MFVGSDASGAGAADPAHRLSERRRLDGGRPPGRAVLRHRRRRSQREVKLTRLTGAAIGKGNFRHFMEKELHEHPAVIGDTLHRMVSPATPRGGLAGTAVRLRHGATHHHQRLRQRVLCRAGRALVVRGGGAHPDRRRCGERVPLSRRRRCRRAGWACWCRQSGETADTLAALRYMREQGQHVLSVAERAGKQHGARERRGAGDGGRARDRCRQHQGVHRAARRAGVPGARLRRARAARSARRRKPR